MAASLAKSFASFNESVSAIVDGFEKKAEEAIAERDQTTRSLHERNLQAQEWKAKARQNETTIAHQNEKITAQADTISQLKRELQYWRDQASNWQEHFLRVEEQRCTITSRLAELVSDTREAPPTLPLTPTSRYEETVPPGHPRTPAKSKPPISVLPTKQSTAPNPLDGPSTDRRPVQTKFIRRVQATYEIKAESDDDELSPEEPQPSTLSHTVRRSRVIQSESEAEEEDDDASEEDELCGYEIPHDTAKKTKRTQPSPPRTEPQPKKKRRVAAPATRRKR